MIGKFAVTLFRRLLMLLEDGEQVDTALVNDYGTKYVVFLDLLGFSELVKRSGADVVERHRLVESLKLVRDTLCEDPAIDFRFTYFSDCIVLSADHSPHALWQIFQSVEILTFNLLQYDIFVRGGMTVGPTHHSRDFVFGTAVTDAYLLERDSARSPIVLLSPEVVKDVEMLGTDFMQWLKEDGEGRFFIHYLMRYAEYTSAIEVGKVILTYPAARIAYFIGQRLIGIKGLPFGVYSLELSLVHNQSCLPIRSPFSVVGSLLQLHLGDDVSGSDPICPIG
jgi:hypothetical protein